MPGAHIQSCESRKGRCGLDDAESLPLNERAYELIRLDILTLPLKPGEKTLRALVGGALRTGHGADSCGPAPSRAGRTRRKNDGARNIHRAVDACAECATPIKCGTCWSLRPLNWPPIAAWTQRSARSVAAGLRVAVGRRAMSDAVIHILLANRDFNLAIAEATGNVLLARTIRHLQNLSLRIFFLGTTQHEAANFWGTGPGKIRDAIVARNGPLARELYAADLAEGERWALRVIMALPELESINLADLNTARSRRGSRERSEFAKEPLSGLNR